MKKFLGGESLPPLAQDDFCFTRGFSSLDRCLVSPCLQFPWGPKFRSFMEQMHGNRMCPFRHRPSQSSYATPSPSLILFPHL